MNAPILSAIIASLLLSCGCSTPDTQKASSGFPDKNELRGQLPKEVIREGTLCDKRLTFDALMMANVQLMMQGYTYDPAALTFKPYILSLPKGPQNLRKWAERWVFTIDGKGVPVDIGFSGDGKGGTYFQMLIRRSDK